MRIAQVAPLYESVPPRYYGGTERVVSYLSDGLTKLGHDVTLFASAESRTAAKLVPSRDCAIRLDPNPLSSDVAAHLSMLQDVRRRIDEFDIIHFHTDVLHLPLFEHLASRTLTTLHGRLDLKDLGGAFERWHQFPLVSISEDQKLRLPNANWRGVVHHGLPPEVLGFEPTPGGGYLAFLGRISPEKRPDRAIEVARRSGLPLKIAAKVDRADQEYHRACIEPLLLGPGVEFIGEISEDQKSAFLGQAVALIFPIDWPEPFGLVMIESMACGTPVVAWPVGSVPEVVENGVTGRLVNTIGDAVDAVHEVAQYDRHLIRACFERRFSAQVMARSYEEIYLTLLDGQQMPLPLAGVAHGTEIGIRVPSVDVRPLADRP